MDLAHDPTLSAATGAPGARLAPGVQVGEYVVERFLGAGAMGEVYAGRHPVIGKEVAIKLLRQPDAEAAERFIREARAASAIDHPNVIDVFAFGRTDDGRLYLVMDLARGQSLRARLADGAFELPRALDVVDALADALDAAHARGIVHRDLKPDNVVISDAGKLCVLDFGIAKLIAAAGAPGVATLTGQGTWLGTPGYMAPEQWSADGAGPASDRYALGVIAFELLTGALPFAASSVPAMMEQHFRAEVPALSGRGLPPALDAVVRRALAKDPEARWPSARAFAEALRGAAGTAVGPAAVTPNPARRLWIPAGIGAGVLGVAVVVVVATRDRPAPTEPPAADVVPPGSVAIEVRTRPDGAMLSIGAHRIGATPRTIYLPRGQPAAVTFAKPGFATVHASYAAESTAPVTTVELTPVTRFAGTWRLPTGELRVLERIADQVDVYKLDELAGPRRFYKHYTFVDNPADDTIAFAADDEVVDPRGPDDPRCHVPVRVEYRYRAVDDALELRRPKLTIDLVDGHCVPQSHDVEISRLDRADGARDSVELVAPAGEPPKGAKNVPRPPGKRRPAPNPAQTFNTVSKKPTSPYTDTKATPTDNVFQGEQQQALPQPPPPQQAPPPAPQQRVQKKS